MVIEKRHIEDVKKIMSVEEEMIRLLPAFKDSLNMMNPWVKQLPGILRGLKLNRAQMVLDIPCGKGGVSVPLARKYGVRILGYDILEGYVRCAREFAKKMGSVTSVLSGLRTFEK